MLKQGLSILIKNQVHNFESKLFNNLPALFSQFIKMYKTGEPIFFGADKILNNSGELDWFSHIGMFNQVEMYGETYTGVIDYVFDYNMLLSELEKYKNKEENWHKDGFIQIGLIYHGDVLLLGIENKNTDQIWRYGNGLIDSVLSKLDDNIFDFFNRLNQTIDEEKLEELEIDTNHIYKNFGEDFWRIRLESF